MKAKLFLIAVTALLFAAASVFAATYYVDQAHVSGGDANPGTEEAPWLTIQKAANTVVAGDTVIVKAGTYEERVSFSSGHSGSPENKIAFKGEPRRSATIQGFFNTRNADYLRIEGFNITNNIPRYTPGSRPGGVWINSDYVEIVDNYFYDIPANAIESNWNQPWSVGAYVADNKAYRCAAGVSAFGDDWLVENNEVERLIVSNIDADYARFFGNNSIFRNNYFHGTLEAEIGASHVDGFQTFNNDAGTRWAHNVTIEGNIVESEKDIAGSYFRQGVLLENNYNSPVAVSDIIIRNNVFFIGGENGGGWGILTYGAPNVTVVHNVFIGFNGKGVGFTDDSLGRSSSGTVKNNIFYDVNRPIYIEGSSSLTGGYNILYDYNYLGEVELTDLIDVDPLLIDPDHPLGADGLSFTTDDGFGLQPGSPAIDAATEVGVTEDIHGVLRPQGSASDIGASEFEPLIIEPPEEPPEEPPVEPPDDTQTVIVDIEGEGTVSISITVTGTVSVEGE